MQRSLIVLAAVTLAGACATGSRPGSQPIVYGMATGKTTEQLVPRIAEISRAKGFVVAREDANDGLLVVTRPDGSVPILVVVQPDRLRWHGRYGACFAMASCWTRFSVRPLSEIDAQLVVWNDAPAAVEGVASDLAVAIRDDAR
jgi:hypothetical protein